MVRVRLYQSIKYNSIVLHPVRRSGLVNYKKVHRQHIGKIAKNATRAWVVEVTDIEKVYTWSDIIECSKATVDDIKEYFSYVRKWYEIDRDPGDAPDRYDIWINNNGGMR